MSGFERHGHDGSSALARALLRAGRDERPSDEAHRRAAVALGLVAGTVGTATTGAVATKMTGALGTKGLSVLGAARVIVTVAAIAIGSYEVASREGTSTPVTTPPPATRLTRGAPPSAPAAPRMVENESPREGPARWAGEGAVIAGMETAKTAPRAAARPATHASGESTSLRDETLALDRARSALAAGDAVAALQAIRAYESAYPRGFLEDEATVLGIDALARCGRSGEAARAGARFLASDPESPHARHVRAVLAALRASP